MSRSRAPGRRRASRFRPGRRLAFRHRRLIGEWLEPRTLLAVTPQLVADLNLAPDGVEVHRPIVEVNGVVYFPGRVSGDNFQLWKSDGTAAGTSLVKNVTVATNSINAGDLVDV